MLDKDNPYERKSLEEKIKNINILKRYSSGKVYDLWDAQLPECDYIVKNLVMASQVTIYCGASESQKTTFLLALALHIASGKDFMGFKVKQSRVLYIDEEMGPKGFQKKVKQIAEAHGIKKEEIKDTFFFKCLEGIKLDTDKSVTMLLAYIQMDSIDVLFIDSLLACVSGDAKTTDMSKLRDVSKVCYQTYTTLIYNHHVGKAEMKKKKLSATSMFGSVEFANLPDEVFGVIKYGENMRIQQLKARYRAPDEKVDINITFKDMRFSNPKDTADFLKTQTDTYDKPILTFLESAGTSGVTFSDCVSQLCEGPNKCMSKKTLSTHLKALEEEDSIRHDTTGGRYYFMPEL